MLPGVYQAKKKDGSTYFRSNITYLNKHISLGSYQNEQLAHQAYMDANQILFDTEITIQNIADSNSQLPFEKRISLLNFRDHKLYIPTPIYLRKGYFSYYLSEKEELKFDIEDLFYFSSHKIIKRNQHLFTNDYGMQVTLLNRYGIKAYAVLNRDYLFRNGDSTDYRYSNIEVINPYYGVHKRMVKDQIKYIVTIHINGNFKVGQYNSVEKAAIAYNKAVDMAKQKGIDKNFNTNFIENLSAKEYAEIYTKLKISLKYQNYLNGLTQ